MVGDVKSGTMVVNTKVLKVILLTYKLVGKTHFYPFFQ